MTPGAVRSQLPAMFIGMAVRAGRRQAQQGMVAIPHPDGDALRLHDVLRIVAAVASQAGVLAHQRIAGLAMIELALRRVPFDDVEVLAVMLGVAAGAVFVKLRVLYHPRVISAAFGNTGANLYVTTQAAEARRAGAEYVANAAFGWTTQLCMSVRERAGRYLCPGRTSQRENEQTPWPH